MGSLLRVSHGKMKISAELGLSTFIWRLWGRICSPVIKEVGMHLLNRGPHFFAGCQVGVILASRNHLHFLASGSLCLQNQQQWAESFLYFEPLLTSFSTSSLLPLFRKDSLPLTGRVT